MCEWLACADWCDVRLMCEGRSFNAHRVVLASVSNFLRKMLLSCPEDELPIIIFLPEFDFHVMSSVLYYIYNGEVSIPTKNLKMFLDTANAMEIFIDQQSVFQKYEHDQYFFKPRMTNQIAMENYKICKLRFCKGNHGYFINVRKATGMEELFCQVQGQACKLNVLDNTIQTLRWGEENIPFRNLTCTSGKRQRQSFLRDVVIEPSIFSQESNVNGHTPDVPVIPNEENHVTKSVFITDKTFPNDRETLSESSKTSVHNSSETTIRNYFVQGNYRESKEKLHTNNIYHYLPRNLSRNFPLGRQCSLLHLGHTKGSVHKSFEESEKCEYDVKTKCALAESRTTGKVTILNEVLQSPWQTRQPMSYTPFPKKVLNIMHFENIFKTKENDSCKDKNNNSEMQSKSKINVHNKLILSEKQDFKCTVCQEVFTGRQNYNLHMRRHSSTPRYSCTECQKTFSQLRNFKYHMSVHRGTKEFAATCSVCGKHFNDRGYLSNHMKIHRNRKEYKCASCPKSFNQRVAFNMHVRIHTGVKPHVCEECGKAFSRKMLLKQHQRTHSGERPYACAHCDKRFADRSNMTLHLRLHTGVKPFSCNLCPKSFTKKHHLKSHLNFHTGAKPYSCPRCKLAFTQSSNMRTHFKKCDASN